MPTKFDPQAKGELTEQIVLTRLMQYGYTVSKPAQLHTPYDFIIDLGGRLLKLQCKTAFYRTDDGLIRFSFRTATDSYRSLKGGDYEPKVDYRGKIDAFIVYLYENDTVYLVPIEKVVAHRGSQTIRISPDTRLRGDWKEPLLAKDFILKQIPVVEEPETVATENDVIGRDTPLEASPGEVVARAST